MQNAEASIFLKSSRIVFYKLLFRNKLNSAHKRIKPEVFIGENWPPILRIAVAKLLEWRMGKKSP